MHTHRLTATVLLAGAFAVGAASTATADATEITAGHWDVGVVYNCDEDVIEGLEAHNHDTDQELELTDVVFGVGSATTNAGAFGTVFGGTLVRHVDEAGSFRVGLHVEYVDAEGDEADCDVPVTIARTGTPTVPVTGARAAAFFAASAPTTAFDTTTGAGRNTGVTTTGHTDPSWGFTDAGTYVLQLTASAAFASPVSAPLTFSVA